MRRSSRSPPPSSRDATRVTPPAVVAASSACSDEGNVVLATRRWSGWEEDVSVEEKGRRIVYYYLRRAPPRDNGDGGGGAERELAVVGALRETSHMEYVVHGPFRRSLEAAAADPAKAPSSRLVAAAAEATQLRWKSRKEVMDWLTSLVSDSPYGSSKMDDGFDEYPSGGHDGDDANFSGRPTTKDLSLTFAGNNPKGFAWLGPIPHLDQRRKHYRSFCREGITVSVHDFVYIKSDEKDHVAYVEDMYEDVNANMVLVRWFDKVDDDHGAVLPPGVDNREIFFSYSLQDLRVEWVDGLASVLNAQHFEQFQNNPKQSNWQPYLCYRQIENDIIGPFDITQLQGYSNQEILRTLIDSSSSVKVFINAPNKNKPTSDGGHKRKRDAINDQANKNHARCDVISDSTIANHTPHNVIYDQISKSHASHNVINDQISKTHAPHNVINDQIIQNHPHSNAINGKTVGNPPPPSPTNDQNIKNHAPGNVIIGKTVEIPLPGNATNGGVAEKCPSHNATTEQTVEKRPPSTGSSSGLIKCISTPNTEQLFQPGCHVEVLSQDSSTRGCWFRCLIIKRVEDLVKVRFQDVQNAEKTRNLKEWLKLSRIANSDKMGIRISGRPRIRPQLPQLIKISCKVVVGTIVDAWWRDGWWEGIVVQQETIGRTRVYFPGENRVAEFHENDLRRSFEWVDNTWTPLVPRKDILCRLPGKDQGNQVKSQESALRAKGAKPELQKANLQFNTGGDKSARPVEQNAIQKSNKGDEKSFKPVAPKALMQSSQKAGSVPAKPAVQKTSLQYGVPGKQAVQKPSLQSKTKGDEEPAKPYPQKTGLLPTFKDLKTHCSKKGPQEPKRPAAGKVIIQSSEKGPQESTRPAAGKAIIQSSEKGPQEPTRPAAGKAIIQSREKGPQDSTRPAGGKAIIQSSEKGPQESTRPASGKAIIQSSEKGPQEPTRPAAGKAIIQSSEKGPQDSTRPAAGKAIIQSSEKGNGMYVDEVIIPYRKRWVLDLRDNLKSQHLEWTERKVRGFCGPLGPLYNNSSQEEINDFATSGDIVPVNSVPDKEVNIIS